MTEQTRQVFNAIKQTFVHQRTGILVLLGLALFFSALAVVDLKNRYRQQFIALQVDYTQQDKLKVQWSKLLLEESTWASHMRVQDVAEKQLEMTSPNAQYIRQIDLPDDDSTIAETQS